MDQIVRNDRYGRCLRIDEGEAQQYDLKHTFMTSGYRLPTTLKRDLAPKNKYMKSEFPNNNLKRLSS